MSRFSLAAPSPRALPRYVRTLVIANLVVLVLLGAVVYLALHASYQSYGKQAQTATENLSSILGTAIAGELKLVDNALLSVRLKLSLDGGLQWLGRADVNRLLEAQLALVPWALAMRIADADGIVRFGPGPIPQALSMWPTAATSCRHACNTAIWRYSVSRCSRASMGDGALR